MQKASHFRLPKALWVALAKLYKNLSYLKMSFRWAKSLALTVKTFYEHNLEFTLLRDLPSTSGVKASKFF
jgi:hypothetical protein